MPTIKFETVYKKALMRIDDLDLASYTESDFREFLSSWLHSAMSEPYFRKKFTSFSVDDTLEEIIFTLEDSVDDSYDAEFVATNLAKGLIVNYFPSKLEATEHLAVMVGGKEEKKLIDNYSKKIERLESLKREYIRDLSRHSYYFGVYGG